MQCLALVERQFAAATHWAAWETVRETSRHERQNPDVDYGDSAGLRLRWIDFASINPRMKTF